MQRNAINFSSAVITLCNKGVFGSHDFWHGVCSKQKASQTLPATREARTMFFETKRNPRKTTRQTLSTEQLEPKAMFSATALPDVESTASDRLDIGPVNRAAEVNQVNSYCTGYCVAGDTGFIKLGDIKGELRPAQNLSGTAGPGGSSFLRSDNRFVIETPKNDNVPSWTEFLKPTEDVVVVRDPLDVRNPIDMANGLSMGTNYGNITGEDGRSIVHPEFSGGVNSLSQANQQPQIASVWTNGNATSIAPRHAAFASMGR